MQKKAIYIDTYYILSYYEIEYPKKFFFVARVPQAKLNKSKQTMLFAISREFYFILHISRYTIYVLYTIYLIYKKKFFLNDNGKKNTIIISC